MASSPSSFSSASSSPPSSASSLTSASASSITPTAIASTSTSAPTPSSTESPSNSPSPSATVSSMAASPSSLASSAASSISNSSSSLPLSSSATSTSSSSSSTSTSSTTSTSTSTSTTSTTSTSSSSLTISPTSSSTRETSTSTGAPQTTPLETSTSTGVPQTTPLETLRSTILVTTTDSLGHTTISAPTTVIFTTTFTSNGVPVTTTETKLNPTLGSDHQSGGGASSFFKNTGAVAGVFVLVGLAAAAIVLWVLFGLRRRRRNRRIEHDTAVSATLAAAGFHRAPLDDDEHDRGTGSRQSRGFADMEMRTGSALALGTKSSLPSARTSGYQDSPGHDELVHDGFNPYQEYDAVDPREGYIPARTNSPPPSAFVEPYRDASGTRPDHVTGHGHSASQSVGSTEPLLASFNRVSPAPSRPTKNPQREADMRSQVPVVPPPIRRRSTSSAYSSESTGDERLNPALRHSDIQDSEDYSRVLGVRNGIPDGVSQVSGES